MIYSDATTFDLGQTCLRLKSGLTFSVRQGKRETWYQIEDDTRGQFFRIGAAEYTFLSMLDGETTLATALAQTCSVMGAKAFTEDDAINLCKWLVDVELAHTDATTSSLRLTKKQDDLDRRRATQQLNPISIRLPLHDLDGFATLLNRYFGWLINVRFALVWAATVAFGLVSLVVHWETSSSVNVFSRDNWIWFALTWVVLKIIHESAHVLACKRFGGKVGKGGILFLLLIPMPYVDVTSAWRFTNKHSRMLVSAAGMLAEIFLAAVAAIVWSQTGPGALHYHAANVMMAASLHTLLFNANPLMRFDGYHILADWLEMPNLGNHGQQFVNGVCRKLFFNLPSRKLQYSGFHGHIVRAYGVGAMVWKVLICFGLSFGALNLFPGFGLVLAVIGVILWLGIPVGKLTRFLIYGSQFETPSRLRFTSVMGVFLFAVAAVGHWAPAPSVINAPLVIEFKDTISVRPEASGFIREILVRDQQVVEPGQLLVVMENRELATQHAQLKLELSKSRLRARELQNDSHVGAWQAEQALIASLQQQLRDVGDQINHLEIRAAGAGQVVARNLSDLKGRFVEAGIEMFTIGDRNNKEAIAMVSQDDAKFLASQTGGESSIRIWGVAGLKSAIVSQVKPTVVDDLPHFAFAGIYGGPIDVVKRKEVESDETLLRAGDLMMTRPRVAVHLDLNNGLSQSLKSGQVGLVHFRGRYQSLGSYLADRSAKWIQANVTIYHGL